MAVNLSVFIELKGNSIYVGNIYGNNYLDARFSYADEYMKSEIGRPISISLPFTDKPFDSSRTRCFFEGLLPEGFTRKCIANGMHVDERDYLSIIANLGNECIGAIRIIGQNNFNITSAYHELSEQDLHELAKEGASESAQLVTKSHLSLTGASGKTGLYYSNSDNKWYLPIGDAPSTHIVKQSHVRLSRIVANEQLCLLTAQNLGIEIPESYIVALGNFDDCNVLFATKRYDRLLKNNKKINGLIVPYRLHQEDFAQALGIEAKFKYEKKGDNYFKLIFDLIKNYSSEPIKDQLRLWDICIFNYLVGNTDNHIKNLSLLYSDDLKSIRLAPAYDIISTIIYKSSTDCMAMSIGGIYKIYDITRTSFEKEARNIGLGAKLSMSRFDKMVSQFENALKTAENNLVKKGFTEVSEISSKILYNFKNNLTKSL